MMREACTKCQMNRAQIHCGLCRRGYCKNCASLQMGFCNSCLKKQKNPAVNRGNRNQPTFFR